MRIVLTGGGTGGHVIPNFAVIEELRKECKDLDLLYVGSKKGPEREMVHKFGVKFQAVSCGKLRRYFSVENVLDFFRIPKGVVQAWVLLRKFKPHVIFAKGGYVSVPVVLAGALRRIPIICHESDLNPGLANRICFRFADKICLSFEESMKFVNSRYVGKTVVTGNLVRSEISKGRKDEGWDLTGFSAGKPVLLVMGGSQGAKEINTLVENSLNDLLARWQVVHVRGKGNMRMDLKAKGYKQYEYLDAELPHIYAISDVVVSRGGANSLSELAVLKKKAVVVPLGTAASRGDQIDNAKMFAREFGWAVLGENVSNEGFMQAIELSFKAAVLPGKIKNGVKEVVSLILKI